MAKTLDEAGVKRLIQEIKGTNKNLNTPIPISTENTPESMAQNVTNIADYVEKAKVAGIANVNGMAVTCLIDDAYSGVGYLNGDTDTSICGIEIFDDSSNPMYFRVDPDGTYGEVQIIMESSVSIVTSDMLVEGARKPIILTPSTTEVDEETYQKLLSDDMDVVFKAVDGNLCGLTYTTENNDNLELVFSCFSVEGETDIDVYIFGYDVSITKNSPHTCSISELFNNDFASLLNTAGVVKKSTLSSALQEISLDGTDAERKAKLDQFETDWKALTGASTMNGARFVGCTYDYNGVFTYDSLRGSGYFAYAATGESGTGSLQLIQLDESTGSLTITPLFSHLEAITIYTDNTPEHMQANLDNIAAYEANLQALGVTVDGIMIPIKFEDDPENIATTFPFSGYITKYSSFYDGIVSTLNDAYNPRVITINGQQGEDGGKVVFDTIALEKQLDTYAPKALNAKSLEAITIKTNNSTASKAANVAAIKAYVNNLTALGVDVTKGYMIPAKLDNGYHGFIMGTDANGGHTGIIKLRTNSYEGGWIFIDNIGTYRYLECLTLGRRYANLTTTAKEIIPAINEVNALAKSKQDTLTSGTNIKTVNGQSLLGSGDITISGGGDVTAAGDNTFTGNNVFNGIAIADIVDGTPYQITGDNGFLMFTSGATNEDIQLGGVATPTYSNSAANKQYVDDKVAAAGGVANKLTVTNFDSNSGRPISIQDANKNDVLYVENNVGISYDGPMLTIKKYDNGSGSASWNEYVTNICGKGIEIGNAVNGNYYETVISKGEILLYGSPVITTETLKNELPIRTRSISSTTTETIILVSSSTSAHRIILANPSGTKTIQLPANPYDGETFEIIRIEGVSFTLTNNSGKAMQKCTGTTTVTSMNISSSGKYTCIYSSIANRWYVMRDDFVSF